MKEEKQPSRKVLVQKHNMTISKYQSDKIRVLSFVAILFVIYIHSPYVEASGYPVAKCVQRFVADFGLAIFAVPMFYTISGLLFFKGVENVVDCYPKIGKRFQSLLVPYIIWNLVFVGWYMVMAYTPGVSSFVNSDMLSNIHLSDPVSTLHFLFIEPAGFHLWFLRDLIVFVLLSPILYFAIKSLPWITVIMLFIGLGWIPRFGVVYFALGGVVALHYDLDKVTYLLTRQRTIMLLYIYFLNAILAAFGIVRSGEWILQYYIQIVSVIAVIAVWGLYDILVPRDLKFSSRMYIILSYTFFVYLFHEPAFNIIKKIGLKVIGVHEYSLILLYMINPILMLVIAIGVGMLFQKLLPKAYSICVGGR